MGGDQTVYHVDVIKHVVVNGDYHIVGKSLQSRQEFGSRSAVIGEAYLQSATLQASQ